MGLAKVQGLNNPGYDAVDKRGKKYQVKSTVLTSKTYNTKGVDRLVTYGSFSQIKPGDYNILVFCVFNEDYELLEIWKITRSKLFNKKTITKTSSFKQRHMKLNTVRDICDVVYQAN